jgi:glycosyltransferase involved in cell wall biosynthesis
MPNSQELFAGLRVAVIHDWLVTYAGAERVLAEILALVPHADLFTLVDFLPEADRAWLARHRINTSWLQRLPGARRHFRKALPLMPATVERYDLSAYDVVISSSHAFAKGIHPRRGARHLCYCYTPMRYAWAMTDAYLQDAGIAGGLLGRVARWEAARLRSWDLATVSRVDAWASCSAYIAQRIQACYGVQAKVVYPPVDVVGFRPLDPHAARGERYVTVARLVSYKRIDVICKAFARLPHLQLDVIGTGPEAPRLARLAPPNVTLRGYCSTAEIRQALTQARAFVFAADEDFGIAPVEAQAAGAPVIALGRGGTAETIHGVTPGAPVNEGASGVFFAQQEAQDIAEAITFFEDNRRLFSTDAAIASASRFAPERFQDAFTQFAFQDNP